MANVPIVRRLALVVLATSCAAILSCGHETRPSMEIARRTDSGPADSRPSTVPEIDRSAPGKFETATFALG